LRIHYDSTQISFTDLTNTLSAGEQPTGAPQLDIEDFDDDPEADFYITQVATYKKSDLSDSIFANFLRQNAVLG